MHHRRLTSTAAATALLVISGALMAFGFAAPANAADAPVMVTPADGGSLPLGSSTLVIDFPEVGGNYSLSVECDDYSYYWSDYSTYRSGRESITIDPLRDDYFELAGSTCNVEIDNTDDYSTTSGSFTIASPALSLGEVRATHGTFYPLVKDRYLDSTEFRFRTNRNTAASLTIKDSRGKAIYRASRNLRNGAAMYQWPWKGTTTGGKSVKPGAYRATVSATADGVTRSTTTTVRVATKTVTRKKTIRKDYLSSRDSTKGNCYTSFSEYDENTTLDCWGGAFAATTFTFKIPANATNLQWHVTTGRNQLDRCCRGSITKRGHRVGRTKFQIRVQVTGWRAVDVYGARLSYKARVRI